jgi:hypothetical protein
VRIPGVTDGCEQFPVAMFCYPIGDKSEHTEIRILPGDRVWLDFVDGDARHPIITGYRTKETDNAIDWRRWHHQNIELLAFTNMEFEAGANMHAQAGGSVLIEASSITLRAATITLDGNTTNTGTMTVNGLFKFLLNMLGFGTVTVNGKNVGSDHIHGNGNGGANTTGPV